MNLSLRSLLLALTLGAPAVLAATAEPPGPGPWVVRAHFQDRAQVNRLAAEREPWEVRHDLRYLVIDVDAAGWRRLVEMGFELEIDAGRTADLLRPHPALPGQINAIPGFPCYRTVEETFTSAQALVTTHPELATWSDIGDSFDKLTAGGLPGYDMMVLKLTNSATPGPKPKLLVNAAIHAREYTTAELVTRWAEELVSQYGIDADTTWILDNEEIHLVLQANPDGRKKAEMGILWRKNNDPINCGDPNSWGTDLNRNYPYNWGCCGGSSGSGCAETYRGPGAGSEPEVIAVRNYSLSIFPDYGDPGSGNPVPDTAAGIFIDIHSFSQLVLWPWGGTTTPAPNGTALQTLGRKFAFFNNYLPEQSIYLYATDGTTIDDNYGELGVPSFTFELGTDFFQDCPTFLNTILPNNLQALRYAAKVTMLPYRLPAGPDALSVATVPSGSVGAGQPLDVTSTLNDTRFNNSNGAEPVQNIAAGEVFVDVPPWAPGASPTPMIATDGAFDETVEAAHATLDTTGMSAGRHILFVRGQDAAGNLGPVSAVFITVTVPVELLGFSVQ